MDVKNQLQFCMHLLILLWYVNKELCTSHNYKWWKKIITLHQSLCSLIAVTGCPSHSYIVQCKAATRLHSLWCKVVISFITATLRKLEPRPIRSVFSDYWSVDPVPVEQSGFHYNSFRFIRLFSMLWPKSRCCYTHHFYHYFKSQMTDPTYCRPLTKNTMHLANIIVHLPFYLELKYY